MEREGEIAAEEARQQLPQGHWGSVGGAVHCRGEGQFKSKVKSLCTARSTHKLKNKGNWTRIGTHQTTATDATLGVRETEQGRLSMVCKIGNICGKVDTTNGQRAAAAATRSGNIDP